MVCGGRCPSVTLGCRRPRRTWMRLRISSTMPSCRRSTAMLHKCQIDDQLKLELDDVWMRLSNEVNRVMAETRTAGDAATDRRADKLHAARQRLTRLPEL